MDGWYLNARGTQYSKGVNTWISEEDYWDFTIMDVGTKDIAAAVAFIDSERADEGANSLPINIVANSGGCAETLLYLANEMPAATLVK